MKAVNNLISYLRKYWIAVSSAIFVGTTLNFLFTKDLFPYQIVEGIESSSGYGRLYFHDFDKDGKEERVQVGKAYTSSFFITINNEEQYNAFGGLPALSAPAFGDYDGNGIDELYFSSYHNDSVFLHCYEYHKEDEAILSNFFIDKVDRYNGDEDFTLSIDVHHDFDGDGLTDALVDLNAFYTFKPRKFYVVNLANKSIASTTESGAWKQLYAVANFDADSLPEIITYGYAPGNTSKDYPLTDYLAWLIIYDHDLSYLIPPIPSQLKPGDIGLWKIKKDTIEITISEQSTFKNWLVRLSYQGQPYDTLPLPGGFPGISYISKGGDYLVMNAREATLKVVDDTFKTLNEYYVDPSYAFIQKIDIDKDGAKELFFFNSHSFLIYTSDFRHQVKVPYQQNSLNFGDIGISTGQLGDGKHLLAITSHGGFSVYSYELNKFYPSRWFTYLLVYGLLFLVGRFIVRYRELKAASLDYEFLMMQVSSLKNQLDPHFTFNLLGSIRKLLETSEKEKALVAFDKFGDLLKSSLIDSDKIEAPLNAELKSADNYLELQRFRFSESFKYVILVSDTIPDTILVPKLLLQTHLENAVKHGIRPLPSGGQIEIRVVLVPNKVDITITDNGVGRKNSRKYKTQGTGKGLKITHRLIQLFNQMYGTRLEQRITDNPLGNKTNVGTQVHISVPFPTHPDFVPLRP